MNILKKKKWNLTIEGCNRQITLVSTSYAILSYVLLLRKKASLFVKMKKIIINK